jgi:hypothetical protein
MYWEYLKEFNGLRIFSGEIWVGGLRKRHGRMLADVWQPFSLLNLNTCERPSGLPQDCRVFGGYESDGLLVYFDRNAEVHLCSATDSTSLFKWNTIDFFLCSEIARIGKFYSASGVKSTNENVTSELLK